MSIVKKKKRTWFFVSLLTSVSFIAGVVMIPLGAANGITAVMIAGIVFAAHGFYGTAFYWITFADYVLYSSIVGAITENGITDVAGLSLHFGKSEKEISRFIYVCLKKGLLPGWRFDGKNLYFFQKKEEKPEEISYVVSCPHCGAGNTITKEHKICEYCGSSLQIPSSDTDKINK